MYTVIPQTYRRPSQQRRHATEDSDWWHVRTGACDFDDDEMTTRSVDEVSGIANKCHALSVATRRVWILMLCPKSVRGRMNTYRPSANYRKAVGCVLSDPYAYSFGMWACFELSELGRVVRLYARGSYCQLRTRKAKRRNEVIYQCEKYSHTHQPSQKRQGASSTPLQASLATALHLSV